MRELRGWGSGFSSELFGYICYSLTMKKVKSVILTNNRGK